MLMSDAILIHAEGQMQKALHAFEQSLMKVRTGRAHPALLNAVMVLSYESEVPLNQVASVSVSDAQTLVVTPWDKSLLPAVEKAIMAANLGLNPSSSGDAVHVRLPVLTAERRKDLVKIVRVESESARVVIRNSRREAISSFKASVKQKEMSEDEERRLVAQAQKLTDEFIGKVDARLAEKENDLT
jgi:ribosome recycling factor